MTALHVPAGTGRHHLMPDGDHVAKAAVHDAAGAFQVFEVVASPGPMAPRHVSPWTGVLYLVEGQIRALIGDASYDVRPGDVVVLPAGTPNTFEVVDDAARFVAITSGDGAGRFFEDFASSVPVERPVEESVGAILSVTERHGVSLVGA